MAEHPGNTQPVALVTGASRGLGKAIALALGREGYSVVINYMKSEKEAEEVLSEVSGDSMTFLADVKDAGQVRAMGAAIRERYGRLDCIINNAGIARDSLLLRQTETDWEDVIGTNLKGPFLVMKELAPLMISSGGGHILNIASYSGMRGREGQAAYSASKAGLIGLTRSAARELAEYHIQVNAVLPGYMETGMGSGAEAALRRAGAESLVQKVCLPEEVAGSLVQLLQNRYITGQVISLDSRIA